VEHGQDWQSQVTAQIGARIAYFRERARDERGRKLTAQALADKCTELGLPVGRPAIAKLEKGLRQTITVGELQVISRALNVSPADLMFPLGQRGTVELMPGHHVDTWKAVQWWSGFADRPGLPADDGAGMVYLYQQHYMIVQDWEFLQGLLRDPDSELHASAAANQRTTLAALRTVRAAMRDRGLIPPELPPALASVDTEPGG
jgi:transcriptional regulator with XRE-family HTH domain